MLYGLIPPLLLSVAIVLALSLLCLQLLHFPEVIRGLKGSTLRTSGVQVLHLSGSVLGLWKDHPHRRRLAQGLHLDLNPQALGFCAQLLICPALSPCPIPIPKRLCPSSDSPWLGQSVQSVTALPGPVSWSMSGASEPDDLSRSFPSQAIL